MSKVQNLEVGPEAADMRLDRWFVRMFPQLSHIQVQKLCRKGQIRVDGARVKASDRLAAGQNVRVPPLPDADEAAERREATRGEIPDHKAREMQQMVIHKDDHIIVLNKPAGLAVQGGSGVKEHVDGMLDALCFDKAERPKLVHRIDKDTSGVLVLARTDLAARKLTEAFRGRETRKEYWAITVGAPDPEMGKVNAPLKKGVVGGQEKVIIDDRDGRPALTFFTTIERAGKSAAWVALWPRTGRTHQLRVHMNLLGTPILGDGKYGGHEAFLREGGLSERMHLHARRIVIPHPGGGELDVTAPLTGHMKQTWSYFNFSPDTYEDPFTSQLKTRKRKSKSVDEGESESPKVALGGRAAKAPRRPPQKPQGGRTGLGRSGSRMKPAGSRGRGGGCGSDGGDGKGRR